MTEKYTPEKVAELTAKAQQFRDALAAIHHTHDMSDGSILSLWLQTTDALAAVSADRDRLHKAITEALDHDPLHGRSEGLHCGGMSPCIHGILRAALDKEGNDDGHDAG